MSSENEKMDFPCVSVIIPTYNSARFVTQAIDSALAQTFQNFEILVIDDGSTDNTKEVLEKYGDSIRYLHQINGGVSKARNFGIEQARGKYVAFLDADDVWMPEKLEKQTLLLESNSEVGLCYTGAIKVDENLTKKSCIEAINYDDPSRELLLQMNILILSTSFVRKDILTQTDGFDLEFSTCADKEFWLRISLLTKFAVIKNYLVKYRDVSGSMSSDPYLSKRDTISVLNKFFTLPNLPEKYQKLKNQAFSNNLMVVSGEFLHNGKRFESLKCMATALKLYPQNIKLPLGLPLRLFKRFFHQ